MFSAILAIGIALGISLSSRIASSQPLRQLYTSVQAEIDALRRQQGDLIAERNYAQSDAYVEQWARTDGKMVRPGEVLVVVMPGSQQEAALQEAPQGLAEVDTTPPEPETWTLWWQLFFDGPPPDF
jgi:cell division protein FtsB